MKNIELDVSSWSHSIPEQFIERSALIQNALREISIANDIVSDEKIIALLKDKCRSESNKILADIYQQSLHFLQNS
ncbi:hypothetical protein TUM12370_13530 [Salmonella enterica subsp. enterica serovar Choleraesuis]|nr:hypothetical protein TUM12370_13530 [Salmonella enterica subsp. enterica serovar Choleraesuis]